MYAIVSTVSLDPDRHSQSMEILSGSVVPGAQASPGFISGTWVHSADRSRGGSMELYETKEQAEAALAARQPGPPPEAPVTMLTEDIMEVAASA